MPSKKFLTKSQEQKIVDAIAAAENQTSAEIRIHIDDQCSTEPLQRAEAVFHELGMSATERQNGVLIYIASEDRKAAVYGGKGIHTQVEEDFWQDVLDLILDHFKRSAFEEGMVLAVEKVGAKMRELFPHHQNDVNELSDEISYNSSDKT